MVFDIKGKYALVTGGAQGLGFQYSKELLTNGVGGVLIVDVNEKHGQESVATLNAEYGDNKAVFLKTDVSNDKDLESAYKFAISNFGGLDLVINNAGVLKENMWEIEININCVAVVRSTLLAFKYMGKHNGGNGGVVVNISSIAGLFPFDAAPVYSASKYFVLGFSQCLTTPFYNNLSGISIITICPGVTYTQLVSEGSKHMLEGFSGLNADYYESGVSKLASQETSFVGKAVIKAIKEGENGSVWSPEDNELYILEFPDRLTYRKTQIKL